MSDEVEKNSLQESQSGEAVNDSMPTQPQVSAGTQLRELREARGWSVEQVASSLNLASRQVEALELDNFAALPGMAITRGFIRAYSKLLRVDPVPILASVSEPAAVVSNVLPQRTPLSTTFTETRLPFGKRSGPSWPVIVGVLAVLLAIAFFVAQRAGFISSPSTAEEGLVTRELPSDVAQADGAGQAVSDQIQSGESPSGTAPDVIPSAAESSPEEVAAAPKVSAAPAVAPAAPVAQTNAPTVAAEGASGEGILTFVVKEDSWVEIKREDGTIYVSRIFRAGTTESLNLPGPVSMVIGNAAGVSLSLRGQSVDVVTSNNSNVARLSVK